MNQSIVEALALTTNTEKKAHPCLWEKNQPHMAGKTISKIAHTKENTERHGENKKIWNL